MRQDNQDSSTSSDRFGDDVLAQALERLDTGSEPPMPDLVQASIVQGRRIRHRRRVTTTLGSAMAVLVLAGGAMTLPSMIGLHFDRPLREITPAPAVSPSTMPGIRYPSAATMRTVLQGQSLKLSEASPGKPLVPGRYFRLTGTGSLDGVLLYVAVLPTVVIPKGEEAPESGACTNHAGQFLSTPWSKLAQCEKGATLRKDGAELLTFTVAPELNRTGLDIAPSVRGATYWTKDGWTVQVVATQDPDGTGVPEAGGPEPMPSDTFTPAPIATLVTDLATDDRLRELVLGTAD